jgi:hypothetical protein
MEHNEILGMDAALKYINQTLVDKIGDITLQVKVLLLLCSCCSGIVDSRDNELGLRWGGCPSSRQIEL